MNALELSKTGMESMGKVDERETKNLLEEIGTVEDGKTRNISEEIA